MEVELIKFNRGRLPSYRIETSIVREGGERYVRKRALGPESEEHIKSFVEKFQVLHHLHGVRANKPHLHEGRAVFAYVEGRSFESYMQAFLGHKDASGILRLLERYAKLLRSYGVNELSEYRPGRLMSKLLPKDFVLHNVTCLPITNLDLTFDNLIIDRNDDIWVTDYEWTYDEPVPIDFIIFRSLYVFSLRMMEYRHELDDMKLMEWVKIDPALRKIYQNGCERFIDLIYGKEREHLIPPSYEKKVHSLGPGEELEELSKRFDQVRGELDSAYRMLDERAIQLREYQNAIEEFGNLLKEKDDDIVSLNLRIAEQEERISSLNSEMKNKHLALSEQFESKQKELMTMSDWAYGMKQRLEFIDSTPSVVRAERRARLFREVKDTYRANGISGLFNGFMRRYKPGWATHGNRHEVPANIKELVENVRVNKGRLLVVFPIIPWEFRWQRPQQIISRFAKDGWSVLFVNMSLASKGRRFKDEEEAGMDVKVGKLDENIYQVWLSTENRVNVYHDRIKNGDLLNLLNGLKHVLSEVDPRSVVYAVQFPGWADLVLELRKDIKGKIFFDYMDEHSGFSNNAEAVLRDEEKLFQQSDLVIATSTKLFNKARIHNKSTIIVRNGTDFEMFNSLSRNGEMDSLTHPTIGYYGAISDWFDVNIIHKCASDHPEWNIILIGSTVGCNVGMLEKMPNVKLLGEKPYGSLPGYLAYFDVCIIPFKINLLTQATNPVKFYEYLSSGKPVVSVMLPELQAYQEMCYLADGPEEFKKCIERALKENDPELVRKRIEFAKSNSWDERYHNISKALDDI